MIMWANTVMGDNDPRNRSGTSKRKSQKPTHMGRQPRPTDGFFWTDIPRENRLLYQEIGQLHDGIYGRRK